MKCWYDFHSDILSINFPVFTSNSPPLQIYLLQPVPEIYRRGFKPTDYSSAFHTAGSVSCFLIQARFTQLPKHCCSCSFLPYFLFNLVFEFSLFFFGGGVVVSLCRLMCAQRAIILLDNSCTICNFSMM